MIGIAGKAIIPIVNQRGAIIGKNGIDLDRDPSAVLYLPDYPYTGLTINDRSGSSPPNHGTISGAAWTRLLAQSGIWVLSFDGVDDNVNCGDVPINSVSALTVVGWFKQDVLDLQDIFFVKYLDDNNRVQVGSFTDGNLTFYMCNAGNMRGYFDYSPVVTASKFFHCACVFDGTQAGNANRLKVYIDGVLQTLTFVGTIPATTPNLAGQDFYLGYTSIALDGQIGLFDAILSAWTLEQIQNHRRQTRSLFGV